MTPDQITLVQDSMKKVIFMKDQLAAEFYDRLFAIRPDTRALFKGDMPAQRQKLMSTLVIAVSNLHDLSKIDAAVRGLGQRHAGYGVKPKDYDDVGAALLHTLERHLGKDFTPELKSAWASVYGSLSKAMIAAA